LGHIADAHMPLHTDNHDGQLTDQKESPLWEVDYQNYLLRITNFTVAPARYEDVNKATWI
jgi:hypothetical protein